MLRSRFILASVFALALFISPHLWGQENATITGTVLDPSGAAVPSASISLTNPATGQVRQTVSNNDGIYLFANVGVGNFSLSASASGFVNYTRTGIVVNTGQTLKEDVDLTIGAAGQTVTVQADALQVQTETNELSNLISGQQVTQLATNGRNVTALAVLGMGKSSNMPAFG